MDKGASKLKPTKRIRLTSEDNNYDLHVLTENVDGDDDCLVLFFAVTDPGFGKAHSIAKLLDEMKTAVFENNSPEEIRRAKSGGVVQRTCGDRLQELTEKYGSSKLTEVQDKVDQVKGIMQANVAKALDNVEALDEMEAKAEQLEAGGKQFQEGATAVKRQQRCRYWKVTAMIALIVIIILIIIIASVVPKTKK